MWNEKAGHGQMMDVESSYSDFITCDRTGRRNAVPDIKGEGAVVGTGELTKDMAQMALKKGEVDAAGTSPPEAETSGSLEQEQSKEQVS
ncbi:cAMP-dependent protein kinase inhibitor gamma [Electrophorus electricus]|uniref:cAMP-dependent protein kinase inhibitor gamma n=1 Tax=Electrophorus electricus TaxID=8005 RepID=UPI0015D081DB|nr:cAMP-dependent protein kinase inhibitor gamma [Electrophorus electricus]